MSASPAAVGAVLHAGSASRIDQTDASSASSRGQPRTPSQRMYATRPRTKRSEEAAVASLSGATATGSGAAGSSSAGGSTATPARSAGASSATSGTSAGASSVGASSATASDGAGALARVSVRSLSAPHHASASPAAS